jgi:hypothetical protein
MQSERRKLLSLRALLYICSPALMALFLGQNGAWSQEFDERDVVPPLNATLLAQVRDSRPLPIFDSQKLQGTREQELDEIHSYYDAVDKGYRHPSRSFANSARKDLTYAHLFQEPRKYRGTVVHFEGRLRRVRRYDPPLMLSQLGVRDLYEGWMFDLEHHGGNPICLVFTDLPPGLTVGEDLQGRVAFDGYFFKKYRYQAGDTGPGQAREAPLLIGHAPVLLEQVATASESPSWSTTPLIVGLFTLIFVTLGLAVALHWWYRRGDRHVSGRLASARQLVFVEPPTEPSSSELPPPSAFRAPSVSEGP